MAGFLFYWSKQRCANSYFAMQSATRSSSHFPGPTNSSPSWLSCRRGSSGKTHTICNEPHFTKCLQIKSSLPTSCQKGRRHHCSQSYVAGTTLSTQPGVSDMNPHYFSVTAEFLSQIPIQPNDRNFILVKLGFFSVTSELSEPI